MHSCKCIHPCKWVHVSDGLTDQEREREHKAQEAAKLAAAKEAATAAADAAAAAAAKKAAEESAGTIKDGATKHGAAKEGAAKDGANKVEAAGKVEVAGKPAATGAAKGSGKEAGTPPAPPADTAPAAAAKGEESNSITRRLCQSCNMSMCWTSSVDRSAIRTTYPCAGMKLFQKSEDFSGDSKPFRDFSVSQLKTALANHASWASFCWLGQCDVEGDLLFARNGFAAFALSASQSVD